MEFNINELRKIQSNKNENKEKVYNIVLDQCLKKIKFISKNSNEVEIIYNIPILIPGYPLFDKSQCTDYIISKLINYKFESRALEPGKIYISWGKVIGQPEKQPPKSTNQAPGLDDFLKSLI